MITFQDTDSEENYLFILYYLVNSFAIIGYQIQF